MATATKSRGGPKARAEIIEELKQDHQRAKKAFRDAEKLDAEEDGEELQAIVEKTCNELEVHARLEEECFYPAAREAINEDDLIDEAEVEHGSAKALIAQLREMSPEDDKYSATFKVLGEYINHHVKEEEGEMFPAVQKRSGVSWEEVQQQMQAMRQQLMGEMGMADEEEEEAVEAQPRSGTRAPSSSGKRSSKTVASKRRSGGTESRPRASDERDDNQ